MKNKLSCAQVIALFDFYINDRLNSRLKAFVDSHLKKCTECKRFYTATNTTQFAFGSKYCSNPDLIESISAYVDNELNDDESVRMRKITITNPAARKKLEDMYEIKNEMHNYFNKIKNECKTDYARDIIGVLNGEKTPDLFNKLVWTFTAMLSVILVGFIAMLYF